MATEKQKLGKVAETLVTKKCGCPKCKRSRTLRSLITNFKCADLICDFCGYLAQVKAKSTTNLNKIPKTILGAAWGVQKERMDAGIYFPLFIVLINKKKKFSIFYLSADLQTSDMFVKRKPLSPGAKRPGWTGFYYDLTKVNLSSIVRLI